MVKRIYAIFLTSNLEKQKLHYHLQMLLQMLYKYYYKILF